ncbi:MAG: hypothetical protein ACLQBC_13900 [Syntrophales bacterium]
MSKEDEILCGKMTNMESGEEWNVQFKFCLNDAELHAIVKVESVRLKTDRDDPDPTEVFVTCKALDSIGLVFELCLEFIPEDDERKNEIIADMKTGAIFLVKGQYRIFQDDLTIKIIDPEYLPLPPDFDEDEVREVFRVNDDPMTKVQ